MTVLSFRERAERIKAREDELRAREMTEDVFRASMFALGLRKDDIIHRLNACRPAPLRDAEEARYERSIEWLRDFLGGQR